MYLNKLKKRPAPPPQTVPAPDPNVNSAVTKALLWVAATGMSTSATEKLARLASTAKGTRVSLVASSVARGISADNLLPYSVGLREP